MMSGHQRLLWQTGHTAHHEHDMYVFATGSSLCTAAYQLQERTKLQHMAYDLDVTFESARTTSCQLTSRRQKCRMPPPLP